ncbi:MAG: hypothetical protein SGBAC_008525 [Bacillariaceae sp.]
MTSTEESIAAAVDPDTYGKSGDTDKHLEGVKKQYDTKEKLEFYAQVMGDGTDNIHFGKWDGIDLEEPGAYGKASEQMSDWMLNLALELAPGLKEKEDFSYVDLGSGTGAAALRLVELNAFVAKATCLNLCDEQNALATKRAADKGLGSKISVVTGTYEKCPFEDNSFDLSFSQDAFVHAFSKLKAFSEAFRVTKSGGVFVFCDLMCGDGPGVSDEELATFANTNMVNDWLSPEQNVKACTEAGWKDATFVNLTADIRISFQLMLKKVDQILERGGDGIGLDLLEAYKKNLTNRITQVDRGVFKWGVVHGMKP